MTGRLELTPVPMPPLVTVDPLERVLDGRAVGDCAIEAARAHALGWWCDAVHPLIGETVGAVLRRADRARRPPCAATGRELARWVLTSAGLLPAE